MNIKSDFNNKAAAFTQVSGVSALFVKSAPLQLLLP
jgi:hypothetical protein